MAKISTKTQYIMLVIIILLMSFAVFGLAYAKFNLPLYWDEAVYIAMAKHVINSNSGFNEVIRPILLPAIIAASQLAYSGIFHNGLDSIIVIAKAIELLFTAAFLILFSIFCYKAAKIFFDTDNNAYAKDHEMKKDFALFSTIIALSLLCVNYSFLFCANGVYTEIPGMTMMLAAILLLLNDSYILAGIFSGLSFMFRYPFGLYLASLDAAIIFTMLFVLSKSYSSIDTRVKFKSKLFKSYFKNLIKFNMSFFVAQIPVMIYNYLNSAENFATMCIAADRLCLIRESVLMTVKPLFQASSVIYQQPTFNDFTYYFVEMIRQQPLFVLFPFGFVLGIFTIFKIFRSINCDFSDAYHSGIQSFEKKRMYKKIELMLACIFLFMFSFIYFSNNPHKELRYSLAFVPFIILFCSVMIAKILGMIITHLFTGKISFFAEIESHPGMKKKAIGTVLLIILLFSLAIASIYMHQKNLDYYSPDTIKDYYRISDDDKAFLVDLLNTNKTIISTTPLITEFTDANILPMYYNDLDLVIKEFSKDNYEYLVFSDANSGNSSESTGKLGRIISMYNVAFAKDIHTEEWIILSKGKIQPEMNISHDYSPVNKTITNKYFESNIRLSKTQFDKKVIVFRLDAVGDNNFDRSLHNKVSIMDIINLANETQTNMTVGIIPKIFELVKDSDKYELILQINSINANKKTRIEVAQNGVDFTNKGLTEETDLSADKDKQMAEIADGKKILENYFGKITTFIPAYNSVNKDITDSLDKNLFFTLSSIKTNNVHMDGYSMNKVDIDTYMINDWVYRRYKSTDDLINEIDGLTAVNNYAVVELYILNEEDNQTFSLFKDIINNYRYDSEYEFKSIDQLSMWLSCYNNLAVERKLGLDTSLVITYNVSNNAPKIDCRGITLMSNKDLQLEFKNFEYLSNYSFFVKNINKDDISVCVKDSCSTVKANSTTKIS